jgi:hypothetical protein
MKRALLTDNGQHVIVGAKNYPQIRRAEPKYPCRAYAPAKSFHTTGFANKNVPIMLQGTKINIHDGNLPWATL